MPDPVNSPDSPGLPVVGVLACRKRRANGTSYSRVNDVIADSLLRHARVLPLVVPPDASAAHVLDDLECLREPVDQRLQRLDGVRQSGRRQVLRVVQHHAVELFDQVSGLACQLRGICLRRHALAPRS
ncbi:hypothetical protein AB0P05_42570 [Streptomyces flaveolus]|uniref:hypothetical protein n=1 Tax=Streptomyces flaveolus TaxID=67297 RepID=UPI0034256C2D